MSESKIQVPLDEVTMSFEKNGIVFLNEKSTITFNAKTYPMLLKIIKSVMTSDPISIVGKIIQISKKNVCMFRSNRVQIAGRSGNSDISIKFDLFSSICTHIEEKAFLSSYHDDYEKIVLGNFAAILMTLEQEKRKIVLRSIREEDSMRISEIVTTLCECSELKPENEFFRSMVQKSICDNINLIELVSYAKKIKNNVI